MAAELVAEAPFFVAADEGGPTIMVARAASVAGERIEKAYELARPADDLALIEAAEVLRAVLPPARSIANPLLVDGWADVVKAAADEPTGALVLFLSAPPGVDVGARELEAALRDHPQQWIAELRGDGARVEITKAWAAREIVKAWTWQIDGLEGRYFVSSFEPSHAAIRNVKGPGGATRPDKITKADRSVRLLKQIGEQKLVLGIVLEPETVDSQGDIYSADEVARAAHGWMENFQNCGFMHKTLVNENVKPVESYIAPTDFELGGQTIKAGTWLLCVHVLNDAIWKQIKAGELTGFSIGGVAQRVPAQQVDGEPAS